MGYILILYEPLSLDLTTPGRGGKQQFIQGQNAVQTRNTRSDDSFICYSCTFLTQHYTLHVSPSGENRMTRFPFQANLSAAVQPVCYTIYHLDNSLRTTTCASSCLLWRSHSRANFHFIHLLPGLTGNYSSDYCKTLPQCLLHSSGH